MSPPHKTGDVKSEENGSKRPSTQPKILENILQHIGNTPMVRLNRIPEAEGIKCEVLAKCEFLSAGGSHKDRIALRMIEEAERDGRLKPGFTIIEPTSGNTGIGVAMVAAVKGYKCILVMPEKMSAEKQDTMAALGAKIIRTPKTLPGAPESFTAVAQRLHKEIPNSIVLDQYGNEMNPKVHYDETAEEILDECGGKLDMIVMGVGTGGIITGIGRKMKEKCKECLVIGVDPEGSIMAQPESMNKSDTNFWEIEGIGHDWLPDILDRSVIDKWYKCTDKDSLQMARRLIKEEGLLIGGSCGSAVSGALQAIKDAGLKEGQKCVIIMPDSIRNYMTKFLSDTWMLERSFIPATEVQLQYPWWTKTVGDLKLEAPAIITPKVTIQAAVDILQTKRVQQIPVVDNNGSIKGVVSLKTLLDKILSNKVSGTDSVETVINKQFKRVNSSTPLGKLSFVLQGSQYALVIQSQTHFGTSGVAETKEVVTGIATLLDLVKIATQS